MNSNEGWVGGGAACRGEAGRVQRKSTPSTMRSLGGRARRPSRPYPAPRGPSCLCRRADEASQPVGPGALEDTGFPEGRGSVPSRAGRRRARSRGRGGGGRWAQRLAGDAALRPQIANDRRPRLTCSRRYVQAPPAASALLGATWWLGEEARLLALGRGSGICRPSGWLLPAASNRLPGALAAPSCAYGIRLTHTRPPSSPGHPLTPHSHAES